MTKSLLTDHYEFTMLQAAMKSGVATKRTCFEVFARTLPAGRRFGVTAGIGRLVNALADFRFDEEDLRFLADRKILEKSTLNYLENFRFSGNIWAYSEGDLFFPHSPVARVEAPFGEAVLLETLILSILNYDSAVASAGARMISAARGRQLIEMGSRRTHELAAVSAARSAYIVGFASTSNLRAGKEYAIPTAGTVAHAFILAHHDEKSAFEAQIQAQGTSTTILVDTYGIEDGIRSAIAAAGNSLGAIRIDSGDPAFEARKARNLLDSLGAQQTKIVISGDLDEYSIDELSSEPIDIFGVGTRLVTGSGAPTANFVYKLVAIDKSGAGHFDEVAKTSESKSTVGGRKFPWRVFDDAQNARYEYLELIDRPASPNQAFSGQLMRPLQEEIICNGEPTREFALDGLRIRHREFISEFSVAATEITAGDPAIDTVLSGSDGRLVRPEDWNS